MIIPQSQRYIASNPRFALTRQSRPKIQEGQQTIVYRCLEPPGAEHCLDDLVRDCISRNYKSTFKDPTLTFANPSSTT